MRHNLEFPAWIGDLLGLKVWTAHRAFDLFSGETLKCGVWTISSLSLLLRRYAGIWYMRERAAYECRQAMFVYNVFQTFFSLWVFSR